MSTERLKKGLMNRKKTFPLAAFLILAFFMLIIGYALGNRVKNDNIKDSKTEEAEEKVIHNRVYWDIDLTEP